MRVRWFGEPWPSSEQRAPICEDEEFHRPAPAGQRCAHCGLVIHEGDQGVIMAWGASKFLAGAATTDDRSFWLDDHLVCAEHLECFLYTTLGFDPRTLPREGEDV
jgi:hypothetical protein